MRKKIRSEQSETLKKVLRYLKRYWLLLALSIGLAAITVASTLYIPLLTGDAIDCVIGKGQVDFTGVFAVLKSGYWCNCSGTVGHEYLQQQTDLSDRKGYPK